MQRIKFKMPLSLAAKSCHSLRPQMQLKLRISKYKFHGFLGLSNYRIPFILATSLKYAKAQNIFESAFFPTCYFEDEDIMPTNSSWYFLFAFSAANFVNATFRHHCFVKANQNEAFISSILILCGSKCQGPKRQFRILSLGTKFGNSYISIN